MFHIQCAYYKHVQPVCKDSGKVVGEKTTTLLSSFNIV